MGKNIYPQGNSISPWANGGPHDAPPPPPILNEWYHFVQGTLRNHISDVARKTWESLLISAIFQKGRLKISDIQYLGNYFM